MGWSFIAGSPSRARRAARASCSRHLAVPTGMPKTAAISATGRSSRWCRARIVRWSTVSRSIARCRASPWAMASIDGSRAPGTKSLVVAVPDVDRVDRDGHHAAASTERHARLVDEDPSEPGVEAGASPQSGQVAPRLEECLLGDVLGVAGMSGDRLGQPKGLRQPCRDQSVEGVTVAVAGTLDERQLAVDARDHAVRHHRVGHGRCHPLLRARRERRLRRT